MAEANRLNVQVSVGSKKSKDIVRSPSLEQVYGWIHSLSLDPEIEKELIKKVNKYPLDAMGRFRSKINWHISEIQRKKITNEVNARKTKKIVLEEQKPNLE